MGRDEVGPDYLVYSIFGERHALLLTGAQTGGAYTIVEVTVLPGSGPPLHLHRDEDEAFIVLEGEFEFAAAGETVRVRAGGTIAVARGTPHKFTAVGPSPGRLVGVVRPAGLERFFAEAGTRLPGRDHQPSPATPEQVERAIRLMPDYGMELVPEPAGAAGGDRCRPGGDRR
jgi:quercetin dioxygenase-like cupin family protein